MSITRVSINRHGLTVWDRALLPETEVERRLKRVREAMREGDLDVLVVYGDMEHSGGVAYLTNFHSFDPRMPALALVTTTDLDALLKVASRDLSYVSKYVWARSHSSDFLAGDLSTKLQQLAADRRLEDKRAGFVGTRYAPGGLVQNVAKIFTKGGIRDADVLLGNVRRDKSVTERCLLRLAAKKCEAVLGEVVRQVAPGMAESALAAVADYCARKEGCQEVEFLVFTNDDRAPARWSHEHFPFRPPADTPVLPDRSVGLFLAIQYHGYWVEASQSAFVGGPRREQRDAYELGLACFEEMLRGVAHAASDDAPGWDDGVRFRWVHGTGLDREEAPFPSAHGEPAAAGDILAAHVAVKWAGEIVFAGRPIVVTEAGGKALAAPADLAPAPGQG